MMRIFLPLAMIFGLMWPAGSAFADCMKEVASGEVICGQGECKSNVKGEVFCAPSRYGTILTRLDGLVCGAGQCLENAKGEVICSSVDGGSVFNDTKGVRCYGGCAPASLSTCERTPAGW